MDARNGREERTRGTDERESSCLMLRRSRRRSDAAVGRALAGALALAGTPLLVRGAAAAPRVIAVNARRFVFTPDRIALRAGEPVVFELTVQDTFMGFSVPELGIRAGLVPGRTVRLPAMVLRRQLHLPVRCVLRQRPRGHARAHRGDGLRLGRKKGRKKGRGGRGGRRPAGAARGGAAAAAARTASVSLAGQGVRIACPAGAPCLAPHVPVVQAVGEVDHRRGVQRQQLRQQQAAPMA